MKRFAIARSRGNRGSSLSLRNTHIRVYQVQQGSNPRQRKTTTTPVKRRQNQEKKEKGSLKEENH